MSLEEEAGTGLIVVQMPDRVRGRKGARLQKQILLEILEEVFGTLPDTLCKISLKTWNWFGCHSDWI